MLLELCVDKWRGLTECWAQHCQALFELHCSSFAVVSEVTFALDGGDPCSGLAVAIEDKDAVMRWLVIVFEVYVIGRTHQYSVYVHTSCRRQDKLTPIESLRAVSHLSPSFALPFERHFFYLFLILAFQVLLALDRASDSGVVKNPQRPHRPLEVAVGLNRICSILALISWKLFVPVKLSLFCLHLHSFCPRPPKGGAQDGRPHQSIQSQRSTARGFRLWRWQHGHDCVCV